MITIYDKFGNPRAYIEPDTQSSRERGIMRNDTLTLVFSLPYFVEFKVTDFCNFDGTYFEVNSEPLFTENSGRDIEYTLICETKMYHAFRSDYLFLNSKNIFTDARFDQRGKPYDFLYLVVQNLRRAFPLEDWKMGDCIEGEYIELNFDSDNCLSALQKIAEGFDTEYYIDDSSLIISLARRLGNAQVVLERGKDKALSKIQKVYQNGDSQLITRLRVFGGNKNLGPDYRDNSQYLRIPGDRDYVEKSIGVLGTFEKTVFFDDIYPRREADVTAVSASDPLQFSDNTINFNFPDSRIPGITPQITFNTGLLAGYTFDIHDYNEGTKTFYINKKADDQTKDLPNDDFRPAVGDKYVIININMPDSYKNDAEAELLARGMEYLVKNGAGVVGYTVETNQLYFRRTRIIPELGYTYVLKSTVTNINLQIRMMAYKQDVRTMDIVSIELADNVQVQPLIVKLLKNL